MEHSMGHILPDGAHVEAKQGSATVYRVDYPDGWGRMTVYDVMPGVLLSFNDFRTALGGQQHEAWENMVEINHCLRGGFRRRCPAAWWQSLARRILPSAIWPARRGALAF